jgi:hypothetical protein
MAASSKSSDGQSVNDIVFGVRADKLQQRNLPAEVECSDQPIVPASNLKTDPARGDFSQWRLRYFFRCGRGLKELELERLSVQNLIHSASP